MLARIGTTSASVLWVHLLLALSSQSYGQGPQYPMDVTVSSGELAYFPCTVEGMEGIPRWRIENTTTSTIYHHNELPADHWFNQTGLIVLADASRNGWIYTCLLEQFINSAKSVGISSSGQLTVTEGTTASSINDRRGPHVYQMHSANISWTASWRMIMTEASFNLRYFTCDSQMSLAEISVLSSCMNTTVAGLESTGNQLLEVQVCSGDNDCGFRAPAIAIPGSIEPQNVVGLNYASNSFLPTEAPITLEHQPEKFCIFTSKLTSICHFTAIYFDVFSNTGVHRTYSAIELFQQLSGSTLPFEVTFIEGTTNIQLCTRGSAHPIDSDFGSVSQVNIQERCLLRPCSTRNNLFVGYYGRRARILFSSTPEVSPTTCSYSFNTMVDVTSTQLPATSTPIPSSSFIIPAVTTSTVLMMSTSLSEQSSSSNIPVTPVQSSPVLTSSLASPGAIAGIVAIILVLLGTAILYIIFGIIGSIYWRRKRQKWTNPDCEGDSWSTSNSTTASTLASSRNHIDKYWTDA